jgi:hypothetical protein
MSELTTPPRRRTPATARQLEVAGKAIAKNIVQVANNMVNLVAPVIENDGNF